ncbi:serine/threonine-protein kinase PRP4 homolog, partial [Ruditapes philippinarum]|uniref:serine/threonine-protein kinase PRP4 homolog n=1 Tax=Ruditapes philippinarum TaxID=129788 RepID=UPI00295B7BFD
GGKSRRDSSSDGSDVDVSQRYGMETGNGGNRDLEKIGLRDRIRKRQPKKERVPSRGHQGYDSSSEEREINDQRHNDNNEDSESETEKLGRAALASRSTRTVQLKKGSQSRKVQVKRGDALDSELEKEASKKHSRSSKNESRRNVTASSKLVEQKKAPVARERHQKFRSPSSSPEPPPRRGQRSRSRSPVRSRWSSSAASPVQTKRSKSKLPVRKRKSPSPIGSKRSPSRSPVRKRLWLSARRLSRKSRSSSREDKRRNCSSSSRSRSRSREEKPRKIRSEIEDTVTVMEDGDRTCFACQAKNETVSFDHPLFKARKICLKCKVS